MPTLKDAAHSGMGQTHYKTINKFPDMEPTENKGQWIVPHLSAFCFSFCCRRCVCHVSTSLISETIAQKPLKPGSGSELGLRTETQTQTETLCSPERQVEHFSAPKCRQKPPTTPPSEAAMLWPIVLPFGPWHNVILWRLSRFLEWIPLRIPLRLLALSVTWRCVELANFQLSHNLNIDMVMDMNALKKKKKKQ